MRKYTNANAVFAENLCVSERKEKKKGFDVHFMLRCGFVGMMIETFEKDSTFLKKKKKKKKRKGGACEVNIERKKGL